MKTKALRSAKYAALLMVMLLIGYSCSDDPVQQIEFDETQWVVKENITIKENMWEWNENAMHYEKFIAIPELSNFIYNSGALDAYVFIGQQGVDEVQKKLPFVYTYQDYDEQGNPILDEDGKPVIYTETISCDFRVVPSRGVTFYLQASDLAKFDDFVFDYIFRIVFIS